MSCNITWVLLVFFISHSFKKIKCLAWTPQLLFIKLSQSLIRNRILFFKLNLNIKFTSALNYFVLLSCFFYVFLFFCLFFFIFLFEFKDFFYFLLICIAFFSFCFFNISFFFLLLIFLFLHKLTHMHTFTKSIFAFFWRIVYGLFRDLNKSTRSSSHKHISIVLKILVYLAGMQDLQ